VLQALTANHPVYVAMGLEEFGRVVVLGAPGSISALLGSERR
jgi:hypothetical protein